MKISVIITVFNLEKYLEDALDSVFRQTLKADEIIVVNDGSSDNSDTLIRKYADGIIYINKQHNEGVLPAILDGLQIAKGDIITFLDGDDIWVDTKLESVLRIYQEYQDVFLVTHNYAWIDANNNLTGTTDETHRNLKTIGGSNSSNYKAVSTLLVKSILSYKGVWLGSAFSIRRKDLDLEKFILFLENTNRQYIQYSHQDQPLAAFLISDNKDKFIYFLDEILFQYRVFLNNSSGASTTLKKAMNSIIRSKATVTFTAKIVESLGQNYMEQLKRQKFKLFYLEFLETLYSKKILSAIKILFRLKTFMTWKEFIKELIRVAYIFIFGVEKFLRKKALLIYKR